MTERSGERFSGVDGMTYFNRVADAFHSGGKTSMYLTGHNNASFRTVNGRREYATSWSFDLAGQRTAAFSFFRVPQQHGEIGSISEDFDVEIVLESRHGISHSVQANMLKGKTNDGKEYIIVLKNDDHFLIRAQPEAGKEFTLLTQIRLLLPT